MFLLLFSQKFSSNVSYGLILFCFLYYDFAAVHVYSRPSALKKWPGHETSKSFYDCRRRF